MQKIEYKTTKRLNENCINEILRISKEENLTPENLLESAKNPGNPLHSFFEWNNTKAAYNWRLQQARVIVNEIKVIVDSKEYYAFENVAVSIDKESKRVYKPVMEILGNEDLRRQLISASLNHLKYWEEQNSRFEEFRPIIKIASKVRKTLEKKWNKKQ